LDATKIKISENFAILKNWMENQPELEWVEPSGGVVCFPRMRKEFNINTEKFYKVLLDKYDTYVGPGRWFGEEDSHFRIGYAWPTTEELVSGLKGITSALAESQE